jgi:hypothetical protein
MNFLTDFEPNNLNFDKIKAQTTPTKTTPSHGSSSLLNYKGAKSLVTASTTNHNVATYLQYKEAINKLQLEYDELKQRSIEVKEQFRVGQEMYENWSFEANEFNSQFNEIYSRIFNYSYSFEKRFSEFKSHLTIDGCQFGKITNSNAADLAQLAYLPDHKVVHQMRPQSILEITSDRINLGSFNLTPIISYLNTKFNKKLYPRFSKLLMLHNANELEKQRETPYYTNQIGVLFVGLPMDFTGGEINVFDGNAVDENQAKSSRKFKLSNSLVAFYSNCPYSINKMVKGWQILLKYDLLVDTGEMAVEKNLFNNNKAVRDILKVKHFTF